MNLPPSISNPAGVLSSATPRVPTTDVLQPGDYVIELEFAGPIAEQRLLEWLAVLGFQFDAEGTSPTIILDQSLRTKTIATADWGAPNDAPPPETYQPTRYRFLGRLLRPIRAINTPRVRWLFVHRTPFDPYRETDQANDLEPFATGAKLEQNVTYAFRMLAWIKQPQTRENICHLLAYMGFRPLKILALKRDVKIRGRPNASAARWYGLGVWDKPDTVITTHDPFWFEDILAL